MTLHYSIQDLQNNNLNLKCGLYLQQEFVEKLHWATTDFLWQRWWWQGMWPCYHFLVEHKTSPQGHINTLQIKYTNNLTFCLIKSLPCMEKVSLLLLLSRNTVWVLTQILKYLRAASLSCFAVKWLPLHQWNNNWYDNRFIWASSSLQCYFVEWRVKAMAVRSHFWFVCVCLKACCLLSVGGQS